MAKCALALRHSNANVERTLNITKGMLTKESTLMDDKTLVGLRVITEYGNVDNIPVTLNVVKAAEKSHLLYEEHLKQEQLKKQQKAIKKQEQVKKKMKLEEMQTEEKKLHEKVLVFWDEEKTAEEAMERAMSYVHQGGKKISVGMKT